MSELRQQNLANQLANDVVSGPTRARANTLQGLAAPAFDRRDLREEFQQSTVQTGVASHPTGSTQPATQTGPRAPTPRITPPRPITVSSTTTDPTAGEPTTAGTPPAGGTTAPAGPAPLATVPIPPKDHEFSPSSLSSMLKSLRGKPTPETVSSNRESEKIESEFLLDGLKAVFKAAHHRAQAEGYITPIGTPIGTTGTVGVWALGATNATNEQLPESKRRTSDQITEQVTGVPLEVARLFNKTMAEQGLPSAPTDKDLVEGMKLFQAVLARVEEKWNEAIKDKDFSTKPDAAGDMARQSVWDRAVEQLVQDARQGTFDDYLKRPQQNVYVNPLADSDALVERMRADAWSELAPRREGAIPAPSTARRLTIDEVPDTQRLGRFLTQTQLEALQEINNANVGGPLDFSTNAYRTLGISKFGKEYWDLWSKEAARTGIRPGAEGFWAGDDVKVLRPDNVDFGYALNQLRKRQEDSTRRGEDQSLFQEHKDGDGNIIVRRTALVAALTGNSYKQTLLFDDAMRAQIGGQSKFDFGGAAGYQADGLQMTHYMNAFRKTLEEAAKRVNALNNTHRDKKSDTFQFKDDKALVSYYQQLAKDLENGQKAQAKAIERADATSESQGWGPIRGIGIGFGGTLPYRGGFTIYPR